MQTECIENCKACKLSVCIYDAPQNEQRRHYRYVMTYNRAKAYADRKKTLTDTQRKALEIYADAHREGNEKNTPEYRKTREYARAYSTVKYLRNRDKYLETKKKKYAEMRNK